MLITFSGLDGSGKSTLIQELKTTLEKQSQQAKVLTMYYHVSFYALCRALRDRIIKIIGRKVKNKVNPTKILTLTVCNNLHDPKISVNDKEGLLAKIFYSVVRSIQVKRVVLFLDLIIIWVCRFYFETLRKNILILDRYLYDSLADVADLKNQKWLFIKFYLSITPTPDVPILVDVSPEEAFARKREYPVNYLQWRRSVYQKIFSWLRNPLIIVNDDLNIAKQVLEKAVIERIKR